MISQLHLIYYLYDTIQKKIRVAYRSEHNNKHKKQAILLMITDGKKWHYCAVTNSSALLKGNSSNHKGDFYFLNCSYATKNKLKEHEKICNNHNSCHTEMSKWVEKIYYLDLECLLKKRAILSK